MDSPQPGAQISKQMMVLVVHVYVMMYFCMLIAGLAVELEAEVEQGSDAPPHRPLQTKTCLAEVVVVRDDQQ